MTHLTSTEIVDLLDGRLEAGRRQHAEDCASCREQVEALGAVLRSAQEDQVPEPSPLFWEHFSGRLASAIRSEPSPARWRPGVWFHGWRLAAGAIVLAIVSVVAWQAFLTPDRVAAPVVSIEQETLAGADAAFDTGAGLDAWDALEAAAADLEWEDAQSIGIAYRPGSAEPLVADLTVGERAEMARLIQEEMKRHGA